MMKTTNLELGRKVVQDIEIAVTLPAYTSIGMPHGHVSISTSLGTDNNRFFIDLVVRSENGTRTGAYSATLSAADLGIAPSRRTAQAVKEGVK